MKTELEVAIDETHKVATTLVDIIKPLLDELTTIQAKVGEQCIESLLSKGSKFSDIERRVYYNSPKFNKNELDTCDKLILIEEIVDKISGNGYCIWQVTKEGKLGVVALDRNDDLYED